MKSVRVLSVAYPFARIVEATAGGAEHVLRTLDAHAGASGWESIVVAAAGSAVGGELVPVDVRADAWEHMRHAIDETLASARIDLIHLHGVDFHGYLPAGAVPALVTLHLPLHRYLRDPFAIPRRGLFFNCVSSSQRRRVPPDERVLRHVANGVDLDALRPAQRQGDYALAIGRVCPEKGFHHALDAASLAGIPLRLAGEVQPFAAHERYFAEQIASRLDEQRQFVGIAGGERKRELLAQARCVLIPSLIDETSSLVAMEALACGTPVIAFRAGALPEIIDDGRTGLLVDSVAEMAAAIARVDRIDRDACRRAAEERFDARRMAADYFALYREVLERA